MQEQISLKLSRHFVSCPLSLVEKVGDQGKFHIIRDLSYVNKEDGFSVNSLLDADKFPTEWGTAAQVTEIVSSQVSFAQVHTHALLSFFPATYVYMHMYAACPLHITHTFSVSSLHLL